jgi:cytoskeletal protein CcmA (bactofilin family)
VGQVPLKTNSEGGQIAIGDAVGASSVPGEATKALTGNIVGYALTAPDENGIIKVFIKQQSQTDQLQADNVIADTAQITGNAVIGGNLNVSGSITVAELNVTGNVTVGGDLTVQGSISTKNITVNGHIITAGEAPTVTVAAGAGNVDLLNNIAEPSITIEGNDTSGTITIKVGANTAAEALANVDFKNAFISKPRIILTAGNRDSAKLSVYYEAANTANNGFKIMADNAPEPGKTYVFTYFVTQ